MVLKATHANGSTSLLCIKPTFSTASCVTLSYLICPYVKDGSMKNNETTIFHHLWAAPKELSASSTQMGMLKSTMVKNKEY